MEEFCWDVLSLTLETLILKNFMQLETLELGEIKLLQYKQREHLPYVCTKVKVKKFQNLIIFLSNIVAVSLSIYAPFKDG